MDLNECVKRFALLAQSDVRGPLAAVQAAEDCQMLLCAALKHAGRSYRYYELNTAVAAALLHEDAESRWSRGEDIFAKVNPLPDSLSTVQTNVVISLATDIAPTI